MFIMSCMCLFAFTATWQLEQVSEQCLQTLPGWQQTLLVESPASLEKLNRFSLIGWIVISLALNSNKKRAWFWFHCGNQIGPGIVSWKKSYDFIFVWDRFVWDCWFALTRICYISKSFLSVLHNIDSATMLGILSS